MKPLSGLLVCLLLTSAVLPGRSVEFGAYLGAFMPRDTQFKSVYGDDAELTYGLTLGIKLWRGFSLRLYAGQYQREGETSVTKEITRLRLYPITLGLRYTMRLKRVQPFLEAGYHHLQVRETAAIGDINANGNGFALTAGAGFPLSSRFSLQTYIQYTEVSVTVGVNSVQMGGAGAGLAFLVHL